MLYVRIQRSGISCTWESESLDESSAGIQTDVGAIEIT